MGDSENEWLVVGKDGKPVRRKQQSGDEAPVSAVVSGGDSSARASSGEKAQSVSRGSASSASGSSKAKAVGHKVFRITKDGEQIDVTGTLLDIQGTQKLVFGNKGNKLCIICHSRSRDHHGDECPGNFCKRCKVYGHWASNCQPTCGWCGRKGHMSEACKEGGNAFFKENKRKLGAGSSGTKAHAGTVSYAGSLKGVTEPEAKRPKQSEPLVDQLSSFIDNMSNPGNLVDQKAFNDGLANIEAERVELKRVFQLKMEALDLRKQQLEVRYANSRVVREALIHLQKAKDAMQTLSVPSPVQSIQTPGRSQPAASATEGSGIGEESSTPHEQGSVVPSVQSVVPCVQMESSDSVPLRGEAEDLSDMDSIHGPFDKEDE